MYLHRQVPRWMAYMVLVCGSCAGPSESRLQVIPPGHGFNSPREALAVWHHSMLHGDVEQARRSVHASNEWMATVEAEVRLTHAIRRFQHQLVQSYGEDAWEQYRRAEVSPSFDITEPDPSWAEEVEISMVDADRAVTAAHPATGRNVYLLNTEVGWKIDIQAMFPRDVRPREITRHLNSSIRLIEQATRMATDRDKTIPEIKQWLGEAMWGA